MRCYVLSVLALQGPFRQVSQLRLSVAGRVPPLKTLNLLSSTLEGRTLPEVLGLQAGPPDMKFVLRLDETVLAKQCLVDRKPVDRHPLHREDHDTRYKMDHFEAEVYDLVGRPGLVEIEPQGIPKDQDWFTKNGPRLRTVSSIVEPDLETRLPQEWSAISEQGPSHVHLNMGCLIDPEHRFGPEMVRTSPLTHAQWCQSRISSLHRNGLASDPEQMFAHYAVI